LAVRPYAVLRAFYAANRGNTVTTSPYSQKFDISDSLHELSRLAALDSEKDKDATLGPIFIDRSKTGFSRRVFYNSRSSHYHGTRSQWLSGLGDILARILESATWKDDKTKDLSMEVMTKIRRAYSAYYQFTVFQERLPTIASGLGMLWHHEPAVAKCAAWVRWVARERNLYLNDDDEARLRRASVDFSIEGIEKIIRKDREANTILEKRPRPGARRRRNRISSMARSRPSRNMLFVARPRPKRPKEVNIEIKRRTVGFPLVVGFKSLDIKTENELQHRQERVSMNRRRRRAFTEKSKTSQATLKVVKMSKPMTNGVVRRVVSMKTSSDVQIVHAFMTDDHQIAAHPVSTLQRSMQPSASTASPVSIAITEPDSAERNLHDNHVQGKDNHIIRKQRILRIRTIHTPMKTKWAFHKTAKTLNLRTRTS
jgi:hypothetical protein